MKKKIFGAIIGVVVFLTLYGLREYLQHGGKPSPAKLSEIGAMLYLEGNYDEAVVYLKKAAEQGHTKAQYSIGMNKGLNATQCSGD